MHPVPRPLTYAHLSSDRSTSLHGDQATYSRPYFYLGRRHSTYPARPGDRSTHSTRWLKRGHHSLHRPQLSDRSGDCSSPSGASRLSHSDAWALAFFSVPALHPHTHVHPPVCIAHLDSPPVSDTSFAGHMTTVPLAGAHKQDTLCVTQTPLVFMCFLYAMVVVLHTHTQKKKL